MIQVTRPVMGHVSMSHDADIKERERPVDSHTDMSLISTQTLKLPVNSYICMLINFELRA